MEWRSEKKDTECKGESGHCKTFPSKAKMKNYQLIFVKNTVYKTEF